MFGSSLLVGVSKTSNFVASSCVWVGLTRGSVEKEYFQALGCVWVGLTGGGVEGVIFRHQIVFGSGLHVVVSKSCNFQASGCVLVGLTRCGVENM